MGKVIPEEVIAMWELEAAEATEIAACTKGTAISSNSPPPADVAMALPDAVITAIAVDSSIWDDLGKVLTCLFD